MPHLDPSGVAREWWSAIDRQDFAHAASLLAPDAVVDWPLSNERLPSPDDWRIVNETYPGNWRAEVTDVVSSGETVITTTNVSDGGITVLAISRFTIHDGRITSLVEYWPETYAAPAWRAGFVQLIENRESTAVSA